MTNKEGNNNQMFWLTTETITPFPCIPIGIMITVATEAICVPTHVGVFGLLLYYLDYWQVKSKKQKLNHFDITFFDVTVTEQKREASILLGLCLWPKHLP